MVIRRYTDEIMIDTASLDGEEDGNVTKMKRVNNSKMKVGVGAPSSHTKKRRTRQSSTWYSTALMFVLMIYWVQGEPIADQIQERVYEKIDSFMTLPVTTLNIFDDFFNKGGFPHDLQAMDRDIARKYLISLVEGLKHTGLKPFYGLENGYLLGYWHSDLDLVPVLIYREPGNSGYEKDDPELGIHWNTCLNKQTGSEEICQMNEGELYVSCVDNCALTECHNIESSTAQAADDSNQEKWCEQYTIEQYEDRGIGYDGYVPMTSHCVDKDGDFSQTPGEVLVETPTGIVENGTCTFGSGLMVQRALEGKFAYCQNFPFGSCDGTFVGAYKSRNYDPRWRGWYIDVRERQHTWFSDTYLFFSPVNIGITYGHPLYITDDQGRKKFHGVLAIDMVLEDVSNFLVSAFGDEEYIVGVYEDRAPHLMIGVNTGTSMVGNFLIDDNSQRCSEEQIINDECTLVHLNIENYVSSEEDMILRKGHREFQQIGFGNADSVVTFWKSDALQEQSIRRIQEKEEDEKEDSAYLATSLVYEQENANVKWRIMVVVPLLIQTEDSITSDEGLFSVIVIIAAIGFASCGSLFVLFYRNRKEEAVQFGDFTFTSAFILACGLLNLSTLTLLGENTDILCMLRMWAFFLLASMAISPLFVKAFRTWKLLGSKFEDAGAEVKMTNFHAWLSTLPIPTIQAVILITFSFVDPPRETSSVDLDSLPPNIGMICSRETQAFTITQAVFSSLLIAGGCFLAYLSRNIDPRFGDAKAMLFAMYNIAFTVIMMSTISSVVDISQSGQRMLHAIGVFWATVFSSAAFILPRLMVAYAQRQKAELQMARLRAMARANFKTLSADDLSNVHVHGTKDSFNILICTADLDKSEPTLEGMQALLPEEGTCKHVSTLSGIQLEANQFDMIVIGMQNATWSKGGASTRDFIDESTRVSDDGSVDEIGHLSDNEFDADEFTDNPRWNDDDPEKARQEASARAERYLASIERHDTVALRKLVKKTLGEDYSPMAQEVQGKMRLHIWALQSVKPLIEDIQVNGSSAKGLTISLNYENTRLTFLSVNLAEGESESSYSKRCDSLQDILKTSKTTDISRSSGLPVSSHHMFVLGALNFRLRFVKTDNGPDDSLDCCDKSNVEHALKLVKDKSWGSLYSKDELHSGIQKGDILNGFNTLPCDFPPTFKVKRAAGFEYDTQHTPSYADRILVRSAPNLSSNLKVLSYMPCGDFMTSSHKPVLGAFSLVPNRMICPSTVGKFRMIIKDVECSNLRLPSAVGSVRRRSSLGRSSVTLSANPYVMFLWDGISMKEVGRIQWPWQSPKNWTVTKHKSKTLNPKWSDFNMSLVSSTPTVNYEAMLYACIFDKAVTGKDDVFIGAVAFSIQEILSLTIGQHRDEHVVTRQLERHGILVGEIELKIEISVLGSDLANARLIKETKTVPEDEMSQLLETTNYSTREIIDFYTREDLHDLDDDGLIDYDEFYPLCEVAGLKHRELVRMLWTCFDDDLSGRVTKFEMVQAVSPITRGKLEDLARLFFRFYDANKSGQLDVEDIILGYKVLMSQRSSVRYNARSVRNADTLLDQALNQHLVVNDGAVSSDLVSLSPEKIARITAWVDKQKELHKTLDIEAYVKSVVDEDKRRKQGEKVKSGRSKGQQIYFLLSLSILCTGGMFSLFATGAISQRIMARSSLREEQLGLLNVAYFVAAIIGPYVGGWFMDNVCGPGYIAVAANSIISVGALIQWLANTPNTFGLLCFGRFLIGFGLETTFIASPECYRRAFPGKMGTMSGVDTAQRMMWVFLSYQLLPIMADSKTESLDEGTNFSLMICFLLSVASTFAGIAVTAGFFLEDKREKKSLEDNSDEGVIKRTFGSLAKAATPALPSGRGKYKLPISTYLIVVAIKSTGYYFNTFVLYSVFVYTGRFNMPQAAASFATGLTPLLAVPIAPTIGRSFDKIGSRAKIGASLTFGGLIGIILLLVSTSPAVVWIATILLSASTAGLFVCVPVIPMITGPTRTGLGYGLYAVFGNIIDGSNAYIAGVLIGSGDKGPLYLILYSAAFVGCGLLCWILVFFLEKDMSFIERPSSQIIETKLDDLVSASLCGVFNGDEETTRELDEDAGESLPGVNVDRNVVPIQEEVDESGFPSPRKTRAHENVDDSGIPSSSITNKAQKGEEQSEQTADEETGESDELAGESLPGVNVERNVVPIQEEVDESGSVSFNLCCALPSICGVLSGDEETTRELDEDAGESLPGVNVDRNVVPIQEEVDESGFPSPRKTRAHENVDDSGIPSSTITNKAQKGEEQSEQTADEENFHQFDQDWEHNFLPLPGVKWNTSTKRSNGALPPLTDDNILATFVNDGDTAVPSSAWGDTSSPDYFEASSSPERTDSIDERKGNTKEQQPIAKEGNAKEQQPIAKPSLRQEEKKKEKVSPAMELFSDGDLSYLGDDISDAEATVGTTTHLKRGLSFFKKRGRRYHSEGERSDSESLVKKDGPYQRSSFNMTNIPYTGIYED